MTLPSLIAKRYIKSTFPWIHDQWPLIVSAPMLGAATPALGINLKATTSLIATHDIKNYRFETSDRLPIGIGFQNWNCKIDVALEATEKHRPSSIWLYAPKKTEDMKEWARELRSVSDGKVSVWVQVGTVHEAMDIIDTADPDVLVIQGTDAGGHGLARSASIISLLPEVADALEDLNVDLQSATGAVMGTRFLAASEAGIPHGWKKELLRAVDGGISTGRSTLCDRLKTTFGRPPQYDGRALLNKAHEDEKAGMTDEENTRLYKEELKKGDEAWDYHGRMVAYAGTGVGLIKNATCAENIVKDVSDEALEIIWNGKRNYPGTMSRDIAGRICWMT